MRFVDIIISYINEFDNWEIIEQEENKIVAKKKRLHTNH